MLPVQTWVSSSYFFKKQKLFGWIFRLPLLLDKFLHFENVSALSVMISSISAHHASLHLNAKSSQAVQHYDKKIDICLLYCFFLLLFRNVGYQSFPLMICVKIQEKMRVVHLTIKVQVNWSYCLALDNCPFPAVASLFRPVSS